VRCLTARELAALCGYHPRYLAALARAGKIKAVRLGERGKWLFPEEALEFLQPVRRVGATAPGRRS